MKKIVKPILTMLVIAMMLVITVPLQVSATEYWSDCHGIDPFADEAIIVRDWTYQWYVAYYLHDWCKEGILVNSLPYAKIWYISSHGGENWYGKNFLVAGDGQYIWGGDISDLNSQVGGGRMTFAYASCCYSGAERPWWNWAYMLHHGFTDRGCRAYMGYKSTVYYTDSYDFTDNFYRYATVDKYDVRASMLLASQDVPAVSNNIVLYGDGSVHIIGGDH